MISSSGFAGMLPSLDPSEDPHKIYPGPFRDISYWYTEMDFQQSLRGSRDFYRSSSRDTKKLAGISLGVPHVISSVVHPGIVS